MIRKLLVPMALIAFNTHADTFDVRVVAASHDEAFTLVELQSATTLAYRLCPKFPIDASSVPACDPVGPSVRNTPETRANVEREFAAQLDSSANAVERSNSWRGVLINGAKWGVAGALLGPIFNRFAVRFVPAMADGTVSSSVYRQAGKNFSYWAIGSVVLDAVTYPFWKNEGSRYRQAAQALTASRIVGAPLINDPNLQASDLYSIVTALNTALVKTAETFNVPSDNYELR